MRKINDIHIGEYVVISDKEFDGDPNEDLLFYREDLDSYVLIDGTNGFHRSLKSLYLKDAYISDWFENDAAQDSSGCNCAIQTIMQVGCICGAIKRYGT